MSLYCACYCIDMHFISLSLKLDLTWMWDDIVAPFEGDFNMIITRLAAWFAELLQLICGLNCKIIVGQIECYCNRIVALLLIELCPWLLLFWCQIVVVKGPDCRPEKMADFLFLKKFSGNEIPRNFKENENPPMS